MWRGNKKKGIFLRSNKSSWQPMCHCDLPLQRALGWTIDQIKRYMMALKYTPPLISSSFFLFVLWSWKSYGQELYIIILFLRHLLTFKPSDNTQEKPFSIFLNFFFNTFFTSILRILLQNASESNKKRDWEQYKHSLFWSWCWREKHRRNG